MNLNTLTSPLAGLLGQGLGVPTTGLQGLGVPATGLQGLLPTTDQLGLLQNLGLQSLLPTATTPTTTTFGGLQCFTGRVNLIVTIAPSNIVATLTLFTGQTILLTTNSAVIRQQLAGVDNRFATVCGTFVVVGGRLALNVQLVIPQQVSNVNQLLLLLLLLFLIRGQIPFTSLGTTGVGGLINQFGGVSGLQQTLTQLGGATGVTNLVNQLGGEAAITSQLQQAGISI